MFYIRFITKTNLNPNTPISLVHIFYFLSQKLLMNYVKTFFFTVLLCFEFMYLHTSVCIIHKSTKNVNMVEKKYAVEMF